MKPVRSSRQGIKRVLVVNWPVSTGSGWLAGAFVLVALLASCSLGQVDSVPTVVTPGTGVSIAPEFEAFYHQHGGARVFGFAYADAYVDADRTFMRQYFQNAQMVFNLDSGDVALAPLGRWALPEDEVQLAAPVQAPEQERTFPDGDLTVQDEFLTFFENHGGEAVFGRPISAQLDEGGVRAQYFENARLEWRPEQPLGFRVQVGRLGVAHYFEQGRFQDRGLSRPLSSVGVRNALLITYLRSPILYRGDKQVVFVDVLTPERRRPVEGARVELVVSYDGKRETISLPLTDGEGHTQAPIKLDDAGAGQQVGLEISAAAPDGPLIATASQTFTLWW